MNRGWVVKRSGKVRFFFRALALAFVSAGLAACGVRYHYDIPRKVLRAPGSQVWGVALLKSHSGYRISSMTRLNGRARLREKPTEGIASGEVGEWTWQVEAVPSLLPSWKAWLADEKVRKRSGEPGDWSHPAATWQQAFVRAHKLVTYLLGHRPLPLRAKLLLLPDGSMYHKTLVQSGAGFIPLTFAFSYPASTSAANAMTTRRFQALDSAVATTVYEYQHVFVKTHAIMPTGTGSADQEINDEARSQCWEDSTILALTAGTHSTESWRPSAMTKALRGRSAGSTTTSGTGDSTLTPARVPEKRRYTEAVLWARYLEAKSVSSYLRGRGLKDARVMSNRPDEMNAVLSVCRAMTQEPRDITATNGYPVSQVKFVPFFPEDLKRGGAK